MYEYYSLKVGKLLSKELPDEKGVMEGILNREQKNQVLRRTVSTTLITMVNFPSALIINIISSRVQRLDCFRLYGLRIGQLLGNTGQGQTHITVNRLGFHARPRRQRIPLPGSGILEYAALPIQHYPAKPLWGHPAGFLQPKAPAQMMHTGKRHEGDRQMRPDTRFHPMEDRPYLEVVIADPEALFHLPKPT